MRNDHKHTPAYGRKAPRFLLVLLLGFLFVSGDPKTSAKAGSEQVGPPVMRLTWLSIASWLIEVGDLRVIIDGYLSRVPRVRSPIPPDVEAIERVLDALGGDKSIDYLFTNHSHIDHSSDAAALAKRTGAQILGPISTCFQAYAQGIPEHQCTEIVGGEVMELGNGLTVRFVRWHHGDAVTGRDIPRELSTIPTPGANGGLFPRGQGHYPNGGGARAALFTLGNSHGTVSLFYVGTRGFPDNFEDDVCVNDDCVNEVNFGNPKANLIAAMQDAGLNGVDLYIANGLGSSWARVVVPVVNPKAYIPNHWDAGTSVGESPIFDGMPFKFKDRAPVNPDTGLTRLEEFIVSEGIEFFPQQQYMDKYQLSTKGVTRVPNHNVKQKLGLSDVQEFP